MLLACILLCVVNQSRACLTWHPASVLSVCTCLDRMSARWT